MIRAVDLSNWTTSEPVDLRITYSNGQPVGGRLTDQDCQNLLAAGYSHAIIGTQWLHVAEHQLEVTKRNGFTQDIYSWLSWGRDIPSYINNRNYLASEYDITTHWLDAEESAEGYTPQQIIGKIAQGIVATEDVFKVGIYTAEWWWPGATNNSNIFRNYPLWHAAYWYPKVPYFSWFRPYGGWTEESVKIWQFGGSVQLSGLNLDLNIVKDDYLSIPSNPVTLEEVLQMNNALWVEWDNPTPGTPIRHYLCFFTFAGLRKYHIKNATEFTVVLTSGLFGTEPRKANLEFIKAFSGGPEPDEA